MNIVVVHDVVKEIKGNIILNHVNLQVEENDCIAIYGKNGSGKSMFLKAICGFASVQRGTIEVMGSLVGQKGRFAPNTGCLIERPGFFENMSGRKNLEELLRIGNRKDTFDIVELMQLFDLDPMNKKPYRTYSLGMKQKLGIIQAIMSKPRLLILDEPSNNLDEKSKQTLIEFLNDLKSTGTTIILASHDQDEIQSLTDHVYMMENGCLKEDIRT